MTMSPKKKKMPAVPRPSKKKSKPPPRGDYYCQLGSVNHPDYVSRHAKPEAAIARAVGVVDDMARTMTRNAPSLVAPFDQLKTDLGHIVIERQPTVTHREIDGVVLHFEFWRTT